MRTANCQDLRARLDGLCNFLAKNYQISAMIFEDSYQHDSCNIFYVEENIPTRDTKEEFNEQFVNGCHCIDDCATSNECECIRRSGTYYHTSEPNLLKTYEIEIRDDKKPSYECNNNCTCSKYCKNKLVQYGPRKNLKIIMCDNCPDLPSKGLGLVTTDYIAKGNFVCEYAGEIITEEEAISRHRNNEKASLMNYIFCVLERFGESSSQTFIDPSLFGNIGRYINHSCEPNCKLISIRINNLIPKLCIFASQQIGKYCEITIDYGSNNTEVTKGLYYKPKPCLCQSKNCKKYMPFLNYE